MNSLAGQISTQNTGRLRKFWTGSFTPPRKMELTANTYTRRISVTLPESTSVKWVWKDSYD